MFTIQKRDIITEPFDPLTVIEDLDEDEAAAAALLTEGVAKYDVFGDNDILFNLQSPSMQWGTTATYVGDGEGVDAWEIEHYQSDNVISEDVEFEKGVPIKRLNDFIKMIAAEMR